MNSTSVRAECVSSAEELRGRASALLLTTIMNLDTSEACCAPDVTRFSVTFEMTIKPLPEEPSTSGSHPLTDGLDK